MSRKIIDLYLDLPTDNLYLNRMSMYCLGDGPHTRDGYRRFFCGSEARTIGLTLEELDKIVAEKGEEEFKRVVSEHAAKYEMTMDQFMDKLYELGVEWGFTGVNDRNNLRTAELVKAYPTRLKGAAYIDPAKGMAGVRELEYCVKELGLSALYISPIRIGMPANDKRCYPLYAKAQELNIPVFIYANMNLITTLPMDLGHPKNVDEIAGFFPDLRIMMTIGGWPWIPDAVGSVIRHKNLFINMEIIDPAKLAIPGQGYEMLLYAIEHNFPDKFCFASDWAMMGQPLEEIIRHVEALPLNDKIKDNILYYNAKRFFELE